MEMHSEEDTKYPSPRRVRFTVPNLYKAMANRSRNRYTKLKPEDHIQRKRRTIRIGKRLKRRLHIRRPKIKLSILRFLSPMKLLRKLRDSYVNMMLSLAERDFSGLAMGNAIYVPSGMPCRTVEGIDPRKEDEILAYIDYLRTTGKLVPDPVLER